MKIEYVLQSERNHAPFRWNEYSGEGSGSIRHLATHSMVAMVRVRKGDVIVFSLVKP